MSQEPSSDEITQALELELVKQELENIQAAANSLLKSNFGLPLKELLNVMNQYKQALSEFSSQDVDKEQQQAVLSELVDTSSKLESLIKNEETIESIGISLEKEANHTGD